MALRGDPAQRRGHHARLPSGFSATRYFRKDGERWVARAITCSVSCRCSCWRKCFRPRPRHVSTSVPCSHTRPEPAPGTVAQTRSSQFSSYAALGNGRLMAWGYNLQGNLGDGTVLNRSNPVLVRGTDGSPLTGVRKVVARGTHAVALLEDGSLVAWGNNRFGQLGTGGSGGLQPFATPVEVLQKARVADACAGDGFTGGFVWYGRCLCPAEGRSCPRVGAEQRGPARAGPSPCGAVSGLREGNRARGRPPGEHSSGCRSPSCAFGLEVRHPPRLGPQRVRPAGRRNDGHPAQPDRRRAGVVGAAARWARPGILMA